MLLSKGLQEEIRHTILKDEDVRPRARARRVLQPIRRRGNCWVCDGSGRVVKSGCSKLIPCGECRGTGWHDLTA